jgi:multiple sugar transport system permease protein
LRFSPTRKQLGYILISPAALLLVLVVGFPILRTIQLSFYHYKLSQVWKNRFVGLQNYAELLQDPRFWNAAWNTLVFIIGVTSGIFLIGLTMALIMHRQFRGRGVVRSLILIPWAMPPIIVSRTWSWIFDGLYGIANYILMSLGLISKNIPWLNEIPQAMIAVQISAVWRGAPFAALLLLAGLQTIPTELYEAADIDGANTWQKFARITLPSLKSTIGITLIFTTLGAFKSFDIIYGMTRGGPMESTETMMLYAQMHLFTFLRFGYGSTSVLIIVLFCLLFSIVYIRGLKIEFTGGAVQ